MHERWQLPIILFVLFGLPLLMAAVMAGMEGLEWPDLPICSKYSIWWSASTPDCWIKNFLNN